MADPSSSQSKTTAPGGVYGESRLKEEIHKIWVLPPRDLFQGFVFIPTETGWPLALLSLWQKSSG